MAKDILNSQNKGWKLLEYVVDKSLYSSDCKTITSDKSRDADLSGHIIRAGTYAATRADSNVLFDKSKVGFSRFRGIGPEMFRIIFEKLNAHVTTKLYSNFSSIDQKKRPQGYLKDLLLGEIDIVLNKMYLRNFWQHQIYPFDILGVHIVSRMDSVTFASKFSQMFASEKLIYLFIIFCICIIFIKYLLNTSITSSVLEFCRMFISTSTLREPKKFRKKIFFFLVLNLVLVNNSYIQGFFYALQTAPSSNPSIETLDDLIASDGRIYATNSLQEQLDELGLGNRITYENISLCMTRLLKGERLICISILPFIHNFEFDRTKIFVTKVPLTSRPSTFTVSSRFALFNKFNSITQRLFEAGIYNSICKWSLRFYENRSSQSSTVKPFSSKNLIFLYIMWWFGCIFSIGVCLIEVIAFQIIKKTSLQF